MKKQDKNNRYAGFMAEPSVPFETRVRRASGALKQATKLSDRASNDVLALKRIFELVQHSEHPAFLSKRSLEKSFGDNYPELLVYPKVLRGGLNPAKLVRGDYNRQEAKMAIGTEVSLCRTLMGNIVEHYEYYIERWSKLREGSSEKELSHPDAMLASLLRVHVGLAGEPDPTLLEAMSRKSGRGQEIKAAIARFKGEIKEAFGAETISSLLDSPQRSLV